MRAFPGGPVVKTSPCNAGGAGLIPGWEGKIPHASQPKKQNIPQKHWTELPLPSLGIFPTHGSNPHLSHFLHWQVDFFITVPALEIVFFFYYYYFSGPDQ